MPDWRKQGQESVSDRKEGSSLKLEEGTTCFRVMPDKADLLPDGRLSPKGLQHSPIREYRLHRHWGPDDATVTCGKNIDGVGRCWGCDEVIPKLEANPAKAAQARNVGPQEQFVIQAAKFDVDKQKFKMPKLMYLSTGAGIPGKPGSNTVALRVYSKIVGTRKDYVDPVNGYNLNIERTGTGLKTKYPSIEGDESPTKVPLAVTAAVVSLDSLLPKYDEEDMKSLWFGRPRRDRNEAPARGANAIEDPQDPENSEYDENGVDAPMAEDEFTDGDPAVDPEVDPDGEDYQAEGEGAGDGEPVDDYADPDADPPADYDPDAEDIPEEYSNDQEFADEPPPPPPARRPANATRPPARSAQAQRPAARPAAAAARPPARPAARPAAPPARRPPAAPAPPARRPAPAPAKKPARR